MNIKQAKQRFTELTGLPAKEKYVYTAIRKCKGYYDHCFAYGQGKYPEARKLADARTLEYWLMVVGYLQCITQFESTCIFGDEQ